MTHRLSKSRYQTGLQCTKALWLGTHARELADETSETQQHIFDTGTAVGELAQRRFPGGVLVAEDHTQSQQALATTQRLMQDPPPAIFEAAFEHEGVLVRADALVRAGDAWDLYEVKSGTKVKPQNITDVAVQTWVLEGAGLTIRRACLMHLNSDYEYTGGEYDLEQLFTATDVTDDARGYMPEVPGTVRRLLSVLAGPMPDVRIGKQCSSPYDCAYQGHCFAFLPDRPVTRLPRISETLLTSLLDDGIYAIADVPLDYPGLTRGQRDVVEVVKRNEGRFVGDVGRALSGLSSPLYFLDFESFASALPLYPGTTPWQQIPFQWSAHVQHADGTIEHREYLHEGADDPRRAFVTTLLDALGQEGSIVVYSAFENTQLNRLATLFPEYAERIRRVQARLFDLLKTVRAHVQHPDAAGSSSIKNVLPALVPDLSYDGLDIGEGGLASLRYLQHVAGTVTADERTKLFADLREYCAMDTMAMARLLDVIRREGIAEAG